MCGQGTVAVGDEGAERSDLPGFGGDGQAGEAVEERGQRDRGLEPGEGCAETVVDAVAEGDVLLVGAGDVEAVRGVAVHERVAACGAVAVEDRLATPARPASTL